MSELKIKKSESFQELLSKIACSYNLLQIFREHPYEEIRRECLNYMNKYGRFNKNDCANKFMRSETATEFEEMILSLNNEGDSIVRDLLACYIFNSESKDKELSGDNSLAIRAIEFFDKIYSHDCVSLGLYSKLILGRIKKDPELYWQLPGMHEMMKKLLEFLWRDDYYKEKHYQGYSLDDWNICCRAFKLVHLMGDTSLLSELLKLDELLVCKKIYLNDYEEEVNNPSLESRLHVSLVREIKHDLGKTLEKYGNSASRVKGLKNVFKKNWDISLGQFSVWCPESVKVGENFDVRLYFWCKPEKVNDFVRLFNDKNQGAMSKGRDHRPLDFEMKNYGFSVLDECWQWHQPDEERKDSQNYVVLSLNKKCVAKARGVKKLEISGLTWNNFDRYELGYQQLIEVL